MKAVEKPSDAMDSKMRQLATRAADVEESTIDQRTLPVIAEDDEEEVEEGQAAKAAPATSLPSSSSL